MFAESFEDQLIGRLAKLIRLPSGRMRSSLVVAALSGLAMTRYILQLEPVASAPVDEVVAVVGPTIDRYICGEIGRGSSASPSRGLQAVITADGSSTWPTR